MKVLQKNWVRWLGIIPVSILAWTGLQLLTAFLILAPYYSHFMQALYGSGLWLFKEFVFYAAAPYWAVIAGANFAPKHNTHVAVGLAGLYAGIQLTTAAFLTSAGYGSSPNYILGSLLFVISVVLAVFHVSETQK